MVTQASTPVKQTGHPGITWHGNISLEQRETMIREAAYYRFIHRGYDPGHDLEDWLAAEADVERGGPEEEPVERPELEMQQSGVHGAAGDDELKHITKQHPRKGIPQVESIEPQDAPPKE